MRQVGASLPSRIQVSNLKFLSSASDFSRLIVAAQTAHRFFPSRLRASTLRGNVFLPGCWKSGAYCLAVARAISQSSLAASAAMSASSALARAVAVLQQNSAYCLLHSSPLLTKKKIKTKQFVWQRGKQNSMKILRCFGAGGTARKPGSSIEWRGTSIPSVHIYFLFNYSGHFFRSFCHQNIACNKKIKPPENLKVTSFF